MIKKLLRNIFVGIFALTIGIFLIEGVKFIPELNIEGQIKSLILVGSLIGVMNTLILPIVNFILLPIRIVTLGIFSIITSIAMIVIVFYFFENIIIIGLWEFFLLTLIVWVLSFIFSVKDRKQL